MQTSDYRKGVKNSKNGGPDERRARFRLLRGRIAPPSVDPRRKRRHRRVRGKLPFPATSRLSGSEHRKAGKTRSESGVEHEKREKSRFTGSPASGRGPATVPSSPAPPKTWGQVTFTDLLRPPWATGSEKDGFRDQTARSTRFFVGENFLSPTAPRRPGSKTAISRVLDHVATC